MTTLIAPRFVFLSSRAKRPTGRLFWSPPRTANREQNLRILEDILILVGPEAGPGRSGFSVLPMGCSVTRNGAIGYCVFTKSMPTVVRDSHRTNQGRPVTNLEPGLQADLSLWDHQTAQR